MKRRVALFLCGLFCLLGTTPVFASSYTVPTDDISIPLTFSKDSYFTVTLPESISGGSNTSVDFDYSVEGDIAADKQVTVKLDDVDADTDGVQFVLTDASGNTKNADISIEKTTFMYNEIVTKASNTGSVSFSNLTAGTWSGNAKFVIGLETASTVGLYDEHGNLVKSWNDLLSDGWITVTDGVFAVNSAHRSAIVGNFVIDDSVTSLDSSAFYDCVGLTSVSIPDSVISIGDSAFYGCSNLTELVVPDSVVSIGTNAFKGVSNVVYNGFATGSPWGAGAVNGTHTHVYTVSTKAATCTEDGVNTYTCSICGDSYTESIAAIGHSYTSTVTKVATCSATGIRTYTCSNCGDSYTEVIPVIEHTYSGGKCTQCGVTQPSGLYYVDNGKTVYKSWNSLISDGIVTVSDGSLSDADITQANSELVIDSSVTSIGGNKMWTQTEALSYCTNLKSVVIPSSVTTVGYGAFAGCTGLKTVTIPSSVTQICDSAFSGCTGITDLVVPTSVTKIGSCAFREVPHVTYHGSAKEYDDSAQEVSPPTWGAVSIN